MSLININLEFNSLPRGSLKMKLDKIKVLLHEVIQSANLKDEFSEWATIQNKLPIKTTKELELYCREWIARPLESILELLT